MIDSRVLFSVCLGVVPEDTAITIMSTNAYKYNPLDRAADEIRLVTIKAGRAADDVQCTLGKRLSSEAPTYEALSYAWGDAAETKHISLGSFSFLVTDNLHAALRHLRREHEDRTMWIDAICIDQTDDLEKNHQVRMMKRIYERAEKVVVWLGEGNEHINTVFEKLSAVEILNKDELHSMKTQDLKTMFGPLAWKAFKDIFGLAWWKRIWVIQEVEVARNVLAVCGNAQISAQTFDVAISKIREIVHPDLLCLDRDVVLTKTIKAPLEIDPRPGGRDLLSLAYLYCGRESTDARDKLYALLGLSEDMDFEPDYRLSVVDVYARFVTACIKRSGKLDILNFAGLGNQKDIPSWIPDWSNLKGAKPLHNYKSWTHAPHFNASSPLELNGVTRHSTQTSWETTPIHINGAFLCVIENGFVFDTVRSLSNPAVKVKALKSSNTPLMKQWISMYQEEEKVKLEKYGHPWPYNTRDDIRNAFWLTLVADSGPSPNDRPSNSRQRYAAGLVAFTHWLHGSKQTPPPSNYDFQLNLNFTAWRRRFIITNLGFFGLVPMETRTNDLVCILSGGQTPFILRKVEEVSENLKKESWNLGGYGGIYQLIGECYVSGIMDGEAYAWFKREFSELQQQKFVLM